jgi:hypothetical protein
MMSLTRQRLKYFFSETHRGAEVMDYEWIRLIALLKSSSSKLQNALDEHAPTKDGLEYVVSEYGDVIDQIFYAAATARLMSYGVSLQGSRSCIREMVKAVRAEEDITISSLGTVETYNREECH